MTSPYAVHEATAPSAGGWGTVAAVWRQCRRFSGTVSLAQLCLIAFLLFGLPLLVVVGVALFAVPVGLGVWSARCPEAFEYWYAGPVRRARWRRRVRASWPELARDCRLSTRQRPDDDRLVVPELDGVGRPWVDPALMWARTRGEELHLLVQPRPGQTLDDVAAAAPALATAHGAVAHRTAVLSPQTVDIALTMRDVLADPVTATVPDGSGASWDAVPVGRRCDGSPWLLQVRGRHTLGVGCSGAGKGSVMWGIIAGLAPEVAIGRVRFWGIDLKRGVEVAMGAGLFHATAYTPTEAVGLLRRLLEIIDARGQVMIGRTRLHTPSVGDPLQVLVIDELAALTAYADPDTKREASRLLAEILTQGRALGVVVVAFVQDPRKETVGMRGLFTQTIALRLRSSEETRMVLGDGMTAQAPAHTIGPDRPGTAYLVDDTGAVVKVRAHWWNDDTIRATAATYGHAVPGSRIDAMRYGGVVADERMDVEHDGGVVAAYVLGSALPPPSGPPVPWAAIPGTVVHGDVLAEPDSVGPEWAEAGSALHVVADPTADEPSHVASDTASDPPGGAVPAPRARKPRSPRASTRARRVS